MGLIDQNGGNTSKFMDQVSHFTQSQLFEIVPSILSRAHIFEKKGLKRNILNMKPYWNYASELWRHTPQCYASYPQEIYGKIVEEVETNFRIFFVSHVWIVNFTSMWLKLSHENWQIVRVRLVTLGLDNSVKREIAQKKLRHRFFYYVSCHECNKLNYQSEKWSKLPQNWTHASYTSVFSMIDCKTTQPNTTENSHLVRRQ